MKKLKVLGLDTALPRGNKPATQRELSKTPSSAQQQEKKRKRKQKSAEALTTEAPDTSKAIDPNREKKPKGKGKRKRRRDPAADASLSPEELERRKRQRILGERALKLRAEGQEYNKWKAKRQLEGVTSGPSKAKEKQKQRPQERYIEERPQARREGQGRRHEDEEGSRPEGDVQVIIVPIYWNKKKEEKAEVIRAAERVEKLLSGAGIAVGIDTTNKLTPGQKFRFWEERGVKLRVELGPKDVDRNQAMLALTATPGEVAKKTLYQVNKALLNAVQRELGLPVSTGLAVSEGDAPEERHQSVPALSRPTSSGRPVPKPRAASDAVADVVAAAKTEAVAASVQAKPPLIGSGDDLLDDFGELEPVVDEEEGSGKPKKKKKIKVMAAAADWLSEGAAGYKKGDKKGKKPKVVVF